MKKLLAIMAVAIFLTGCNTNIVYITKNYCINGEKHEILISGSSLSDLLNGNSQEGGDPVFEIPTIKKGIVDNSNKGIIIDKSDKKESD
jgi:hypothetical protein